MLIRHFIPWVALVALLGLALGASLFSAPSDCFQSGKAGQGGPAGHASATASEQKAGHGAVIPEHDCNPFWGPHWGLVWATIVLCLATVALAYVTAYLYSMTKRLADESKDASAKALAASTEHTQMLVEMERGFLSGGGPIGTDTTGQRFFVLEVANYGKTPAFLCGFDVHFATLDAVRAGPEEVFPWYPYEDWIPVGATPRKLRLFPVPARAEVVYGAFWYLDRRKGAHLFRFILRIQQNTELGISGVDASYSHWD
jgi:hypothetical protein